MGRKQGLKKIKKERALEGISEKLELECLRTGSLLFQPDFILSAAESGGNEHVWDLGFFQGSMVCLGVFLEDWTLKSPFPSFPNKRLRNLL